ncbi:type II and III secretion system protein family protein [Massilia sp. CF038]|uniref:type II and III secretion system protein family protein n=1 Tax=Massilia sp. CF038 TaxID=1881045 RepID=UPI0009145576|nr:type II and III secretion system protein family protein [Massilia sp. CF038]SHG50495.1 pilus assembly protein CpaC [Massilia sp. CF038]
MSTLHTISARSLLATALTAALAASSLALAAPAKPAAKPEPVKADGRSEIGPGMTLIDGKSTLVRLPYQAARMSVGDPRVADVILLNKNEVYMVGKSVGTTNLILWNKNNDATIIDLSVVMDTAPLRARLDELLPAEKDVHISTAADTIILSGVVADAATAEQIVSVATAFVLRAARSSQQAAAPSATVPGANAATQSQGGAGMQASTQTGPRVINMLGVAAPQQVMLEVKVAEVSKTLVDQLGASIGGQKTNGSWTYSILTNLLGGVPALGEAAKANGNFLTIDAQKRDGLVKVLAEPNIMAISGQEASFLAGGKIFIPVSITNSGGTPEIRLEEKEFGIAVRFTPTVLEGGRINLRVAPEVSDLNKDGVGISAGGVSGTAILPSFTTRRATTTVQLYDGQSFAIGGLIKNNVTTNVKAFPLLGEIPVLGALFRSSDFQTDRTELVFVITPHLVKPLAPGYKLPTDGYIAPSRGEFFLQGKHEGTPPKDTQSAAATGFDLK